MIPLVLVQSQSRPGQIIGSVLDVVLLQSRLRPLFCSSLQSSLSALFLIQSKFQSWFSPASFGGGERGGGLVGGGPPPAESSPENTANFYPRRSASNPATAGPDLLPTRTHKHSGKHGNTTPRRSALTRLPRPLRWNHLATVWIKSRAQSQFWSGLQSDQNRSIWAVVCRPGTARLGRTLKQQ